MINLNIWCSNPAILIYLIWAYIIPGLLNSFLDMDSEIYKAPSPSALSAIYIGLLFVLIALTSLSTKAKAKPSAPKIGWQPSFQVVQGVLLFILIFSAFGAVEGLSKWRYAGEGLSEALGVLSLVYVLAPSILEFILFGTLLCNWYHDDSRRKIILILTIINLALTASGIGPMVTVVLAIIALVFPKLLTRLLTHTEHQPRKKSIISTYVQLMPLIALLGYGGYIAGHLIKTGWDFGSIDSESREALFDGFAMYLIERLSISWYSLLVTVNAYIDLGHGGQLDNLIAPVNNAIFRLSALTGNVFGVEKPTLYAIARVNYEAINIFPFSEREGSTPGLIASFLYVFHPLVVPIFLLVYSIFYRWLLAGIRLFVKGHLTLPGEILLLYFTAGFLACPPDLLIIFDPSSIGLIAWIGMSYAARKIKI